MEVLCNCRWALYVIPTSPIDVHGGQLENRD